MLRDEIVKLVQECVAIMKEQKDYDFEILNIDDGEKHEKEENKTVFHIDLSWSDKEHRGRHPFQLVKIVSNAFAEEDRIEKGKGLLKEMNKATNDFKAGKEYEPTYMEKLRNIFKLTGMLGGNGEWYF